MCSCRAGFIWIQTVTCLDCSAGFKWTYLFFLWFHTRRWTELVSFCDSSEHVSCNTRAALWVNFSDFKLYVVCTGWLSWPFTCQTIVLYCLNSTIKIKSYFFMKSNEEWRIEMCNSITVPQTQRFDRYNFVQLLKMSYLTHKLCKNKISWQSFAASVNLKWIPQDGWSLELCIRSKNRGEKLYYCRSARCKQAWSHFKDRLEF